MKLFVIELRICFKFGEVDIDVANNVLDAALKISFLKVNLYVTYILQR